MLASSMHITTNARFGSRRSPRTPSPAASHRKRRAQSSQLASMVRSRPSPAWPTPSGPSCMSGVSTPCPSRRFPTPWSNLLLLRSTVASLQKIFLAPLQFNLLSTVASLQSNLRSAAASLQFNLLSTVASLQNFSGVPPVQLTVDGGVPPARLTVGGGVPPVQLTVDGGVPPEIFSGVPPVQLTDDGGVPPVQCASGSVSNIGSAPITLLGAKRSDSGATQRCADHSALCVSSALLRRSQCGPAACMRSDCVVTQPHVCAVVSVVQPHVCAAAVL